MSEADWISEEQGTDFGGPATDTKTEETRPDQAREKRKRRPGRGKARKEKNKEKQGFSFTRLYDKLKKKLREIMEKLESSVKKLREGLSELFKKKEELRALLRDEANRRTWRLFKRQARAICRHILPTKITGRPFRRGISAKQPSPQTACISSKRPPNMPAVPIARQL